MALIERRLQAGANISQVFVDTVGPPEKYQVGLLASLPRGITSCYLKFRYFVVEICSVY